MDDRLEDQFPFYALGALSDEERAQVDAYVAADPAARARLAEVQRTAAVMPLSAAPIEPRAQIKARLMERVQADARAQTDARVNGQAARRAAPIESARRSGFDLAHWFENRFFRLALPALTAAALVAASLLAGWAASLDAEVARLRQETALLQQQLSTQREVLAQIASPQVQALTITGTDLQPTAFGQLLADPRTTTALLIVSDLRSLPADRVYQFWLIRNDVPISGGIFSVDDQGRAVLPIELAEAVDSFDAMGVSIEPLGGSRQPTGDIVMLSRLPAS
ncbi:MAG: anti-sigma factor [Chloroflexi bacterium]|nr:anti-sigma factor [Chloroflexota bacterium]